MKILVPAVALVAALAASAPAAAQTEARTGVQAGDLLLRLRTIMVAPNEQSGSILPGFPGEKVRLNNQVVPEVDVTWMATDHIGFELIAATTKHRASGVRAAKGLEAAVGRTSVSMKDSFGWAGQAGVDVDINPRMFLNFDVKYIDIDTTARLTTAAAGTQRVKMDIDPLVFGVGFGLRL